MNAKINRRDLRELSFEFEELEEMLAELIENCFDITPDDINTAINLSFTIRIDGTGFPKIQSFGKYRVPLRKPSLAPAVISRIEEDALSYVITMDILGQRDEDIEVVPENESLVVMSRKNRVFYKKFFIPKNVEATQFTKTFKNNVLEIVLKKKQLQ